MKKINRWVKLEDGRFAVEVYTTSRPLVGDRICAQARSGKSSWVTIVEVLTLDGWSRPVCLVAS